MIARFSPPSGSGWRAASPETGMLPPTGCFLAIGHAYPIGASLRSRAMSDARIESNYVASR